MKLVAVVAGLACGCMSPVVPFGAGKSPTEAQHDRLDKLMPALLAVDGTWAGEVKTAKIRVWADDEYRAQNVHWEHAFGESLEYANAVLSSTFGVRFVAEYHAWDRHAPGVTLTDDLDALAREDPGDGVFGVVGLTSSMSLVTATFDQLGLASLPGRYLMVRGYSDVEAHKALEREFRNLRPDERESLFTALRLHQTTAVLLHELGHNLGAPHEVDDDTIMNATYSHRSASFSEHARAQILAMLDARLGRAHAVTDKARGADATIEAPAAPHTTLTIVVTAAGATTVDGRTFDDATLDGALRYNFTRDHEAEIVIKADRGAPHDVVIRLVDRAKSAGLHRITMTDGS